MKIRKMTIILFIILLIITFGCNNDATSGLILSNATTDEKLPITTDDKISSTTVQVLNRFVNPIIPEGADPWVTEKDGIYYWCPSNGFDLFVKPAVRLQDLKKFGDEVAAVKIWSATEATGIHEGEWSDVWAPELHYLENKWYVYFAATTTLTTYPDNFEARNKSHRMFVLESDNPTGPFVLKGQIKPTTTDKWAIDGTVFSYNSTNYYIWSGWEGDTNGVQKLYIATMENPWTLSSARVEISAPDYDWEKHVEASLDVNEGPQVITSSSGIPYIIYSADFSGSDDYCLGQLKLTGSNPMNPDHWTKKDTPVFQTNSAAGVYGPGHASFVKSNDTSEDWIVYHAAVSSGSAWDRDIRVQKFNWTDNEPQFPVPTSKSTAITGFAGTIKMEAEDAELVNVIVKDGAFSSGLKKVGGIDHENSSMTFEFELEDAGDYRLIFAYSSNMGGDNLVSFNLKINEQDDSVELTKNGNWETYLYKSKISTLVEGLNTITVMKGDNYAELDCLYVVKE